MKALKYHMSLAPVSANPQSRFMSVVGSIQYMAQVTRPDLAYFAGALAQHFSESTEEHWQAAMHCLRYLQSTKNFGLTFDGSIDDAPLVEAYSDADFANSEDKVSVSGSLIRVFGNPVCWIAKRQHKVARNTTEAELIAMSSTADELLWVKKLLVDLGYVPYRPKLWGDNQSANRVAANHLSSHRTKSLDVKDLSVQGMHEREELFVDWVGTKDQMADILTKVLPGPATTTFCSKLHLQRLS